MPSLPGIRGHGHRGADQHDHRHDQDQQGGHLHFKGLDLLAEIFGRAADHQPGDEHGDDGEGQHAVEPAADAAEDDFALVHQPQRDQAAQRRIRIVHRVDGAARGGRGGGRPDRRLRNAVADLLAFHVSAGLERAGAAIDAQAR